MEKFNLTKYQWGLISGDIIAIFLTVAIGFRNHETLNIFFQRFAFTFIPWTFSWLLIAPKFQLFDDPAQKLTAQIKKIIFAMVIASPLAAILRAAWLGSTALPFFALIMGASSALRLIIWRIIYSKLLSRSEQ